MKYYLGCLGLVLVTLTTGVALVPGDQSDNIRKAIEAGVHYLRQIQGPGGQWFYQGEVESTALCALTLLECDVEANDPAIVKAAQALRQTAVKETHTYRLALDILFFDRLGDPKDDPLIEALTYRLLRGQNAAGGWSYNCLTTDDEERNLKTRLDEQRPGDKNSTGSPKPGPAPGPSGPTTERLPRRDTKGGTADYFKKLQEQSGQPGPQGPPTTGQFPGQAPRGAGGQAGQGDLPRGEQPPGGQPAQPGGLGQGLQPRQLPPEALGNLPGGMAWQNPVGDNSNTQFALMALWAARRHGLPVERALAAVERRFRASQDRLGGWRYQANFTGGASDPRYSTAAMTCAGILGVSVAYGVVNDIVMRTELKKDPEARPSKPIKPKDPSRDPSIHAGLQILGEMIRGPYARAEKWHMLPAGAAGMGPAANQLAAKMKMQANVKTGPLGGDRTDYYGLWSIERVAMALSLKTIAKVDWYVWGSRIILPRQNSDGSWKGEYGTGGVDTSFALLFLRRSNLTRDLTAALKGKILDPSEVRLRAGGVGGASLKDQPLDANEPVLPDGPDPKTSGQGRSTGPKLLDPERGSTVSQTNRGAGSAGSPRTQAADLSAQVVEAASANQAALIARYELAKGSQYTQALAEIATQLSGKMKTRARDALAQRLSRMTANTLGEKLRDEHLEIRRAAALAVALKGSKSFVPELIQLLSDPEPPVARAAHAALKDLTSEDFGPEPDASRAERNRAIASWKKWWSQNK